MLSQSKTTAHRPDRTAGSSSSLAQAVPHHGPDYAETRALAMILRDQPRVTIVQAPPGYGKSRLLQELALRLRELGEMVHLDGHQRMPQTGSVGRPGWVLIDDIDIGATDLGPMLAQRPARPHTHIVMTCRTLPALTGLPLSVMADITLLDLRDLMPTDAEADRLLVRLCGQTMPAAVRRVIINRAEGWPAMLMLFGAAARRIGRVRSLFAPEILSRGQLADYFSATLLDQGGPEIRWLLQRLSLFNHFNPPMVAALLGQRAAGLLQRAQMASPVLIPSEEMAGGFRFHGLLRTTLRADYLATAHQDGTALLSQASRWCEAADRLADAVDYALEAGEAARAHDLLCRHARTFIHATGQVTKIRDWVARLVQAGVTVTTELRLWQIWSLVFCMRLDEARAELDLLPPSLLPPHQAHLEQLRISIAARGDDAALTRDLAEQWVATQATTDMFKLAAVQAIRSLACAALLDDAGARLSLAAARTAAAESAGAYAGAWVGAIDALLELGQGNAPLATELLERCLSRTRQTASPTAPILGTMDLIAARVQYERGDIVAARDHMDRGAYALPSHCLVETDILAWETRIGLTEASSGIDAALAELREWTGPSNRLRAACTCAAVGLLLRAGRAADARQHWEGRVRIGPDGMPMMGDAALPPDMALQLSIAGAWLQFATGQHDDAARLASGLLPIAEQHGRQALRVKILLLKAALHLAEGDRVRARGPFRLALELAARNDLFATVHELAWALLPLLTTDDAQLALGPAMQDFVTRLRDRLGLSPNPPTGTGSEGLIEELTGRETEILRALESGLSAQAVADGMSVSLATVKWHIQNIYSKLGVNNRTGALATARRLSLL